MKQKKSRVSNAVIRRLPRYRRYLGELRRAGVEKISSKELSDSIGYTASQIRQDLNNFGDFGQQGYGYSVAGLYREISAILGLDKDYRMVLVGAGNLGQAISKYAIHNNPGFELCAAFEINKSLIGGTLEGIPIYDATGLGDYIKKRRIDIGIICVNRGNAQEVVDIMVESGIKGIWNFALVDLEVPESVALESVHLSDSLHALAYHMNDRAEAAERQSKDQPED